MMVIHLQKRAAICLKPPRTCAICNNAWHNVQWCHKKSITCGIVLDSICTTGTTQLPCHVGSLQEQLTKHILFTLHLCAGPHITWSNVLIYAQPRHTPGCWSTPRASATTQPYRWDKHPAEKTSRWWTSGGLVPIVPHTKKGSRTCHTFTASNIGRENQQTPSCQLYIFDSYHINESQHSAVPEGSRNTIHHSSHCCAAEKLQGTLNRGRMWGNSEKCELAKYTKDCERNPIRKLKTNRKTH